MKISVVKPLITILLILSCATEKVTELFVVSPHSPEIKAEFGRTFEQNHYRKTGEMVKVRWIDAGGTGEAVEYVKSRNSGIKKAGGVDCFFGGGDLPYFTLEAMNLLDSLQLHDSILAKFPETIDGVRLRSEKMRWIGAALSGFGILYNKVVINENNLPVPDNWEILADPVFRGFIATGDPRYAGTIHVMFEIILQYYGWEKGWKILYGLSANARSFEKGATIPPKHVAMGQAAAGISIDFYGAAEIGKHGKERLAFVLPKGKTVVTPDGIAVVKNGSNGKLAQEFVRFVLTDGQRLWISKKGTEGGPQKYLLARMAADSSAYKRIGKDDMADIENPFYSSNADSASFSFNSKLASKRWSILNDLAGVLLVSGHGKLKKLSTVELHNTTVPVTENEALAMATGWTKPENAGFRLKTMNSWAKSKL